MTKELALSIIGLAYQVIMIWFLISNDKVKKRIGIGMLITLGILVVLPLAGALLFLMTCFGIIGAGAIVGH